MVKLIRYNVDKEAAMVVIQNHLGEITMTKQYFSVLVGNALSNCFGVVEKNAGNAKQTVLSSLPFLNKKNYADKGVNIYTENGKLFVDVHITVMYGVNVSTVVESIQHKVAYTIEDATDITVEKVNVYIDGIKSC